MILEVPFYMQKDKNDCGPTALKMALEYLGEKHETEELMKLVDPESSGTTWTLSLANGAAMLGFKAEFYSKILGFNPDNYKLDFYKIETDCPDNAESKIKRLHETAFKLGVKQEKRTMSIGEILSKISKDCISVILLDWSKIKGTDKYQGHFVPIVGYDEKNVFVHNQGFNNPQKNLAISKELFDKARKAEGTDEDIVFIYRKK